MTYRTWWTIRTTHDIIKKHRFLYSYRLSISYQYRFHSHEIEYKTSFHVFVTHYFYDTTTQRSSRDNDKFNSESLNSR